LNLVIERAPFGIRLTVGRFQAVFGYLNRFAVWWDQKPLVNLYRPKHNGACNE
jgi:hypothetical protein